MFVAHFYTAIYTCGTTYHPRRWVIQHLLMMEKSRKMDMLVGTELESSTITTMRGKLLLSAAYCNTPGLGIGGSYDLGKPESWAYKLDFQ